MNKKFYEIGILKNKYVLIEIDGFSQEIIGKYSSIEEANAAMEKAEKANKELYQ